MIAVASKTIRRRFHTITLGCKLNQFDSAAMEGELLRRGFAAEPDRNQAGVVIINTCTVTHRADSEARKLIRSVRRNNPECRLLVTGCFAELDAAAIEQIPGVDRVFGNREKPMIPTILDQLGMRGPDRLHTDRIDAGCDDTLRLPETLHFGERSRAFLKVQEGCDLVCSYCIIPKVRGLSRSVDTAEIQAAMRRLFRSGYGEVVLTGVNTGDYGKDLQPARSLVSLLETLLAECGDHRLRLNSLEPLTITDSLIELFAQDGSRLAPHLQVPLQSGSDTVLRRMRRNYKAAFWIDRLEKLRMAVPRIGLGADVIVGFPGETDQEFQETCDLLERSPVNYLHVFSWSPRPGTPASELPDRVDPSVIKERSAILRGWAEKAGLRFRQRFLGAVLECVVLDARTKEGRVRALSDNFIEVGLDHVHASPGELVQVILEEATEMRTTARIL